MTYNVSGHSIPGTTWANTRRKKEADQGPPKFITAIVNARYIKWRLPGWRIIVLVVTYVGVMTNFIPPLELYLRQYHQINEDANTQWSYGQVSAGSSRVYISLT